MSELIVLILEEVLQLMLSESQNKQHDILHLLNDSIIIIIRCTAYHILTIMAGHVTGFIGSIGSTSARNIGVVVDETLSMEHQVRLVLPEHRAGAATRRTRRPPRAPLGRGRQKTLKGGGAAN